GLIWMALPPVISQSEGSTHAFILCGIGLFFGILGFILFYKKLEGLDTEAGTHPINKTHLTYNIAGVIAAVLIVANILHNTTL
ncbi:MFS transporter, partial [Francisella tularensis subsp. holarctica]|nr:MFS transporter [Francisella tularensis subsp. holarctica]